MITNQNPRVLPYNWLFIAAAETNSDSRSHRMGLNITHKKSFVVFVDCDSIRNWIELANISTSLL